MNLTSEGSSLDDDLAAAQLVVRELLAKKKIESEKEQKVKEAHQQERSIENLKALCEKKIKETNHFADIPSLKWYEYNPPKRSPTKTRFVY